MIADRYLQLRSELETALADLLKLGSELRRPGATLDTIHGLLADIREPLLFVVVGEVKSGKSSLLNALFGQEFAKVDVLPATDRICIFRHGAEEKQVDVSPKLIERYLPVPFLRDFNVVDTPGTNTMVSDHQTITENFVPRADLVLFVFSVINPWTQSAWDFLKFVQKKWLKNVVFVLQQADLRDSSEVEIIRRHLQDTAMQKLGFVPPIFAVSARQALLARMRGLDQDKSWRESEFGALEEQINLIVAESGARMLKLRSAREAAGLILDEMTTEIRASVEVINRDEERLTRVDQFVQARKEQTLRQVSGLVRRVEQACRDCANEGARLLKEKLSLWRTWKILWSRGRGSREFQMQIETKLRQTVEPQVEQAVQLLEADLRGLWPQLHDMLDTRLGRELREQVPKTVPDFARQRRELLQSVHLALVEHIAGKSVEEQLTQLFQETSARLRVPAGVAAVGGIAALIAAMSSAAVADVTGILAATAAVTGTFLAFNQRRKILRTYETQMEIKCSELVKAVEEQLNRAIELFYGEITIAFQPLAAFCVAQRRIYEPILQRADELKIALDRVAAELG
jgi:GTPase Era involved in 16S rRNA processing